MQASELPSDPPTDADDDEDDDAPGNRQSTPFEETIDAPPADNSPESTADGDDAEIDLNDPVAGANTAADPDGTRADDRPEEEAVPAEAPPTADPPDPPLEFSWMLDEGADLPDYTPTHADRLLASVYGDYARANDGSHLDGGIPDDARWQHRWKRVVQHPSN